MKARRWLTIVAVETMAFVLAGEVWAQTCAPNGLGSPVLSGHESAVVQASANWPDFDALGAAMDFFNNAECGSAGGAGLDYPFLQWSGSVTVNFIYMAGQ